MNILIFFFLLPSLCMSLVDNGFYCTIDQYMYNGNCLTCPNTQYNPHTEHEDTHCWCSRSDYWDGSECKPCPSGSYGPTYAHRSSVCELVDKCNVENGCIKVIDECGSDSDCVTATGNNNDQFKCVECVSGYNKKNCRTILPLDENIIKERYSVYVVKNPQTGVDMIRRDPFPMHDEFWNNISQKEQIYTISDKICIKDIACDGGEDPAGNLCSYEDSGECVTDAHCAYGEPYGYHNAACVPCQGIYYDGWTDLGGIYENCQYQNINDGHYYRRKARNVCHVMPFIGEPCSPENSMCTEDAYCNSKGYCDCNTVYDGIEKINYVEKLPGYDKYLCKHTTVSGLLKPHTIISNKTLYWWFQTVADNVTIQAYTGDVNVYSRFNLFVECSPGEYFEVHSIMDEVDMGDYSYILHQGECKACPVGTWKKHPIYKKLDCTAKTMCGKGEYTENANSNTMDNACIPCPYDHYMEDLEHENDSCLLQPAGCGDGQTVRPFSSEVMLTCVDCQPGFYKNTRISYYFSRIFDRRPCYECSSGFYQPEYSAIRCISQTVTCGIGEFAVDSRVEPYRCELCEPGTYMDDKDHQFLSCKTCTHGKYSTTHGAEFCEDHDTCGLGFVVSSISSISPNITCEECTPGTFSGTVGYDTTCIPCVDSINGSYAILGGAEQCIKQSCPAGRYVDQIGNTTTAHTCKDCPSGTYNLENTFTSCIVYTPASEVICTNNEYFHPATSMNNNECLKCPDGSMLRIDNHQEESCWEGSFDKVKATPNDPYCQFTPDEPLSWVPESFYLSNYKIDCPGQEPDYLCDGVPNCKDCDERYFKNIIENPNIPGAKTHTGPVGQFQNGYTILDSDLCIKKGTMRRCTNDVDCREGACVAGICEYQGCPKGYGLYMGFDTVRYNLFIDLTSFENSNVDNSVCLECNRSFSLQFENEAFKYEHDLIGLYQPNDNSFDPCKDTNYTMSCPAGYTIKTMTSQSNFECVKCPDNTWTDPIQNVETRSEDGSVLLHNDLSCQPESSCCGKVENNICIHGAEEGETCTNGLYCNCDTFCNASTVCQKRSQAGETCQTGSCVDTHLCNNICTVKFDESYTLLSIDNGDICNENHINVGTLANPICEREKICNFEEYKHENTCHTCPAQCNNGYLLSCGYGEYKCSEKLSNVLQIGQTDHLTYIIDDQNNPDLTICKDVLTTFERTTSGHPFHVNVDGWVNVLGNSQQSFTFDTVGTYTYVCTSHTSMTGIINVVHCDDEMFACSPNFYGPTCEDKVQCSIADCNNRGNATGNRVDGCICTCDYGYEGSKCQTEQQCDAADCNNNGLYHGTKISGCICECSSSFTGTYCDIEKPCTQEDCNGNALTHHTFVPGKDTKHKGCECICETNYEPNGMQISSNYWQNFQEGGTGSGKVCDTCAPLYEKVGGICQIKQCTFDTIESDDITGLGTCVSPMDAGTNCYPQCKAGTYSDPLNCYGTLMIPECRECEEGFFQDGTMSTCQEKKMQCLNAQLIPSNNKIADNECLCLAGYSGTNCDPCLNGYFKNSVGSDACTQKKSSCPAGKGIYKPNDESTTEDDYQCIECDEGFFQDGNMSTCELKQEICSSRQQIVPSNNKIADNECQCLAGRSGTDCDPCLNGYFKDSVGSDACTQKKSSCPAGEGLYKPNTESTIEDDYQCIECNNANTGFSLAPSTENMFNDDTMSGAECLSHDTWLECVNDATCTKFPCASGYYLRPGTASENAKCALCDPGTYSASNDQHCTDCAVGTHDHDQDPSTECQVCGDNTYQDELKTTSCKDCPVGSSMVSSIHIEDHDEESDCVICEDGICYNIYEYPLIKVFGEKMFKSILEELSLQELKNLYSQRGLCLRL